MRQIRNAKERLLSKIEIVGLCWIWTGRQGTRGYGEFKLEGKTIGTHRASWILHNGPISDGLHVLHRCDVKLCINPDHLYLGTNKDNMNDRAERGSSKYGKPFDRFMLKVDKSRPPIRDDLTPCWWWTGRLSTNGGYGEFRWCNKTWRTHRASWTLHNGPITDGSHVLHKCDNALCVNPDHLYLGTNQQNVDDRESRGRGLTGRPGRKPKLTLDEIDRLMEMAARKVPQKKLGEIFDLSQQSVWAIIHRQSYKYRKQ